MTDVTKLAVVGSRDVNPNQQWIVRAEVQTYAIRVGWDNLTLVSGGARGVDTWAEQIAVAFGIPIEVYRADWKRYGPSAGHRRNAQIVEAADAMLAFFGDERTPGTTDSIRQATAKGIPVKVFHRGVAVPS